MPDSNQSSSHGHVDVATSDDGRAFSLWSKNPEPALPLFAVGQDAWLTDEDGDEPVCHVTVAEQKPIGNPAQAWQYQVKDKRTDDLIEQGKWFSETALKHSKPLSFG